jgi:hypothetical protein
MPKRGVDPGSKLEVATDEASGERRVVVAIQMHLRLWYTPKRAREIAAELLKAAEQIERKG